MTSFALLGGSFDPIHNGHLHIAREILRSGIVSGLAFLPNARHNFKKNNVVLDFDDRIALVRAALEPGMEVWTDDSEGSGYTSDLMKRLYQKHPDKSFLFVIGSDILPHLSRWHDFDWLQQNVEFLVVPRAGYDPESKVINKIKHKSLDISIDLNSSTLVRSCIAKGRPISGMVPAHLEQRMIELYKPLLEKQNGKR